MMYLCTVYLFIGERYLYIFFSVAFIVLLFWQEKRAFITNKLREKYNGISKNDDQPQVLTAEEMAEFYKAFLDKNYSQHMRYNMQWYKKNFSNLRLALMTWIESKFTKKVT